MTDERGKHIPADAARAQPEPGVSHPRAARRWHSQRSFQLCLLFVAAVYYFAASYKIAISKEPWIDEGWFASPAYNLAFHGFMGTTVLEPTGSWLKGELKGIHEFTYWVMPLYLVAQAGWYRLFGFGLLQMRLLSTFWGVVALASLYFIVDCLTQNSFAASLAVCLTAFDFTFLWSATDGRMDMMCVGLGLAGLAAYLLIRNQNPLYSLFAANFLMAASVFTHPNGVIWVLCLATLVLSFDRKRLRLVDICSVLPYAAFAAGWGIYIAKRPDYFIAQFTANANLPTGSRGAGLLHPDIAFQREFFRYLSNFRDPNWSWPGWPPAIWIPVLYGVACVAAYLQHRKTRDKALGFALEFLVLCVFMMTFFDTLKAENYLVLAMPLYAVVAAVWVSSNEHRRKTFLVGCSLVAILLTLQIRTLVEKLRVDPFRDDYRPVVAFLKTLPSAQVDGDAVLGFGLGYDRLVDDARIGLRTGRKPELLVADRWYKWSWDSIFWHFDMQAYYYTRGLRERGYHPVFERGNYTVYQLNSWTPPTAVSAHVSK